MALGQAAELFWESIVKVEVHVVLCFTFPRVVPRELQKIELPDQYELRMRDGGSVAAATSAELETDVAEGVTGESSELRSVGEIFPLPYLWASPRKPRGKSRRGRQRFLLKQRLVKLGQQLVDTLNQWYGSVKSSRRRKRRGRQRTRWAAACRLQPHLQRVFDSLRMKVRRSCCAGDGGGTATEYEDMGKDFYGVHSFGRGGGG